MDNSKNDKTNIILIDCPDQKGLIHTISGVLSGRGFNIISNREYVDRGHGHFYMRTEFEGDPGQRQKVLDELAGKLPAEARIKWPERKPKKVVVLASREHHCLAELLVHNAYGDLDLEVQAVVSNHGHLRELTEKFGLPFHCCHNSGPDRGGHEAGISEILDRYEPDYLVLAKYMRILSPEFVTRFEKRIINIHHSFLPAFAGANPYRQAFERGVKIIGATAHFVTEKLDEGPIIVQDTAAIDHTYGVDDIKRAGRDMEELVLTKALRLVVEDRVLINGNKTIVFS